MNDNEDMLLDYFGNYRLALAEEREARERMNYAGAALELASIKARLAEIRSQADALNGMVVLVGDREKFYAAAFYVVVGRMPDNAGGDAHGNR